MPALPPDFRWIPAWLDVAEAAANFAALLDETPWEDRVLRIGGRAIPMPRRVAFYGPHAYRYSGLVHAARPPSALVDDLRRRIETIAGHPFNTVLLNLYRSGLDSVSWHSDDDYPHGGHPAVASLSLGAARRYRIASKKRSDERHVLELTTGGLLVMEGRSQLDYRHTLPMSKLCTAPRINLTFRYMSAAN